MSFPSFSNRTQQKVNKKIWLPEPSDAEGGRPYRHFSAELAGFAQ
jgi:hypothetical protein